MTVSEVRSLRAASPRSARRVTPAPSSGRGSDRRRGAASSATMWPSSRKITRSATDAATASWVTMTTAWPNSSTARRSSARISCEVVESRLPVGSSAKITAGSEASARATATRCCWPPESSDGRCVRRSASATASSSWSTRPSVTAAGERQRQAHVLLGGEHRHEVEGLEDEADLVAPQAREVGVVELADLGVGDRHGAAARAVEPREHVHQRGLAGPRGAHDRGEGAGLDLERDAAERVDGGVTLAVALGQVLACDDWGSHAEQSAQTARRGQWCG